MKTETIHRWERTDADGFSPDRIAELEGMLIDHMAGTSQIDEAGRKAFGRIKGNAFSATDVATMSDYVGVLLVRKAEAIVALRTERDKLCRNEHDRKAYDGLIDGIRAGGEIVRRIRDRFLTEFQEARLAH